MNTTKTHTMTREQAISALIALTDKKVHEYTVSRQSAGFKTAMAAVQNPGVEQVCGKNVGSGNYASSKSWANSVMFILTRAGIPYKFFNVAPKGGKAGDRIKVTL